jgi:hypothetical protein
MPFDRDWEMSWHRQVIPRIQPIFEVDRGEIYEAMFGSGKISLR